MAKLRVGVFPIAHSGRNHSQDAVMNVDEAISTISAAPEGSVLIAKWPLSWGADAMFVELDADYLVPAEFTSQGYEPLLSREEICDQLEFLRGKKASSRTIAEFIIHYANLDAPPHWIKDIPDL